MACHPEIQQQQLRYPLVGKHFSVETAFGKVSSGWPGQQRLSVDGIAPQAICGHMEGLDLVSKRRVS